MPVSQAQRTMYTMLLPKRPSVDLQNALSTHAIPHRVVSDQGTHFMVKEVWHWAHTYGNHWSYHVPLHHKAAGLIQQWKSLLKTVTAPARWQYLAALGQDLFRKLYIL